MADPQDIAKMKVADLKRELKNRGLFVTGNKTELAERLQAAIMEGEALDDTALSEDHLLGDDDNDDVLNDDELDEETKKFLDSAQDEDAILKSPTVSNASNSPDEPPPPIIDDTHVKKVILKRKLTTSISETDVPINTPVAVKNNRIEAVTITTSSTAVAIHPANDADDDGQKGVKVSKLSLEERLELRAKKFGAPQGSDVLKQARAERFGIAKAEDDTETKTVSNGSVVPSNTSAATIISNTPAANVELLKKRAERFGSSVSKVMNTIEQIEKLQKRQERFGSAKMSVDIASATTEPVAISVQDAASTTNDSSTPKIDYAEKARLRLERFKTPVN